jgi:L-serine/L-threonine ammonia-lyase
MGVLMGAERAGWRDETCLVAAETRGADCLAQALAADALVTLPGTARHNCLRRCLSKRRSILTASRFCVPSPLAAITSVATSLGAPSVTRPAFDAARARRPGTIASSSSNGAPIHSFVASDAEAVSACLRFADDHRLVVEPACGAALAAVYTAAPALRDAASVVVVVCGGAVVDVASLRRMADKLGLPAWS